MFTFPISLNVVSLDFFFALLFLLKSKTHLCVYFSSPCSTVYYPSLRLFRCFYSLVPFSRRIAFIKHVRALWRIHWNEIRRSTNEIKWNHVHACASRYDNVNLVNAFWLSFIHSFIHHTSGPEYRKRIIGTRYVGAKWKPSQSVESMCRSVHVIRPNKKHI